MFLDPVVVLVGAGASAEFGIPTGVGVYEDAKNEDEENQATSTSYEDQFLSTFWEFLRFSNLGREQNEFRQLIRKLKESHAFSIDLYAYYNPQDAQIAKLFTAWRIIKEQYGFELIRDRWGDANRRLVRSYNWRNPTVGSGSNLRNNWMGELSNVMLSGAKTSEDLKRSNLTFVTFNYDEVIEETLPWIVNKYERFADATSELMPRVIHIHGKIESPEPAKINAQHYSNQANKIKFISDTLDQPSKEVAEAKQLLVDAHRVYCVGFAFEQLNLELLGAGQWGGHADHFEPP
jgi:hypothetical protein